MTFPDHACSAWFARVMATSKEDLAPRVLKELNKTHEAAARTTYERCIKKFELDRESAWQRVVIQGKDVTQQLDSVAATTSEENCGPFKPLGGISAHVPVDWAASRPAIRPKVMDLARPC